MINKTYRSLYHNIIRYKSIIFKGIGATFVLAVTEVFTGSLFKLIIDSLTSMSAKFSVGEKCIIPIKAVIKHPITHAKISLINCKLTGTEAFIKFMLLICLIFFIIFFIKCLCFYLRTVYTKLASQNIIRDFKLDIFRHLIYLPNSFFEANQTGDLVSRVTYDVTTLSEIVTILIEISRALIYIGVFVPIMFFINWQLALFTIIFFPLSYLCIRFITVKIKRVSKHLTDNIGSYTAFLEEKLNDIRSIKKTKQEASVYKNYKQLIEHNFELNKRLIFLKSFLNPSNEFLAITMICLIFIFYIYQLGGENAQLGDIAFFIYITKTTFKPAKKVAQALGKFNMMLVSIDKIFGLFDESKETEI
jgi:ABC-type multidrug transport system fused ATPase/permease subunit